MWLDRLNELKERTGMTIPQIAKATEMSERTIKRILSGEKSPYLTNVIPIIHALGGSCGEIFEDTKAVVGNENLATLQEKLDIATAELDLIKAENAILKDKVAAFTAENELLKLEIKHKDEIIAIHNYYTKLKPNE